MTTHDAQTLATRSALLAILAEAETHAQGFFTAKVEFERVTDVMRRMDVKLSMNMQEFAVKSLVNAALYVSLQAHAMGVRVDVEELIKYGSYSNLNALWVAWQGNAKIGGQHGKH